MNFYYFENLTCVVPLNLEYSSTSVLIFLALLEIANTHQTYTRTSMNIDALVQPATMPNMKPSQEVKEICPRGNNKVLFISLYHDKCLLFMLVLY